MELLILQFKQFAQYCRDNGMGGDEIFESECMRMLYSLSLKEQEIDRLIDTLSGELPPRPTKLMPYPIDYSKR